MVAVVPFFKWAPVYAVTRKMERLMVHFSHFFSSRHRVSRFNVGLRYWPVGFLISQRALGCRLLSWMAPSIRALLLRVGRFATHPVDLE
jgi:hypothetical protein